MRRAGVAFFTMALAIGLAGGGISMSAARSGADKDKSGIARADKTGRKDLKHDRSELAELFKRNLASELGVTPGQLDGAWKAAALATLDEAIAKGLIPASKADALRAAIESGKFNGMGFGLGQLHKRAKPAEAKAKKRAMAAILSDAALRADAVAAIESQFGMSVDEIRAQARDKGSLWDLAKAKGVTKESLGAAIADAIDDDLARLAKDGSISTDLAGGVEGALRKGWLFPGVMKLLKMR